MTTIKHDEVVDSFLRVAKMPMRMYKWLTAEQWLNIIKSLHDFERKEEELDTQTLNVILGKKMD